jgi:hypothetical protein
MRSLIIILVCLGAVVGAPPSSYAQERSHVARVGLSRRPKKNRSISVLLRFPHRVV